MSKRKRLRLKPEQEDDLLNMLFWRYPKGHIFKRFKERWDIALSDGMYTYWKTTAEKSADEAVEKFKQRIFNKYLSQREVRLEVLMDRVEKALQIEHDPDDPRAFKQVNEEVRKTLKQIATELNEWRTGDTYNIVFNVVGPLREILAFWAIRHIPAGPERELALDDLKQITGQFLQELPVEAKQIAARTSDND